MRYLAAVLFACVVRAAFAQESPAPAANFTVVDERAEADKKQKTLSLNADSCDYGVARLGEKRAPGRFDALRADLASLGRSSLAGKTLHVPRYDIYFNNSAALRTMLCDMETGGVHSEHKCEFKGAFCPREEMKAGWFDLSEVSGSNGPLIIELTATLDGVPHEVRVVYSTRLEMMGGFRKPEEKAELSAAMRKVAEALAQQLP